jgi:hypothetical protein
VTTTRLVMRVKRRLHRRHRERESHAHSCLQMWSFMALGVRVIITEHEPMEPSLFPYFSLNVLRTFPKRIPKRRERSQTDYFIPKFLSKSVPKSFPYSSHQNLKSPGMGTLWEQFGFGKLIRVKVPCRSLHTNMRATAGVTTS